MNRRIITLITNIVFFLVSILFINRGSLLGGSRESNISNSETVKPMVLSDETGTSTFSEVLRVVDGDTIELSGGEKVRYIGIDTPETGNGGECFFEEAKKKNEELVLGKTVRLEKDVSERDRYGRLLRYVYVGDLFINKIMVEAGYAKVSTYPPDVKYQETFIEAERYARESNLGLWEKCVLIQE